MNCPNCQSDESITEQNYGALYTCTSCLAVYFINFEGQPEYGEVPTEAPTDLNYGGGEDPPLSESLLDADFENKFSQNLDAVMGEQVPLDGLQAESLQYPLGQTEAELGSLEPLIDSNLQVHSEGGDSVNQREAQNTSAEKSEIDFNSMDYLNSESNPFESQSQLAVESPVAKERSAFQNVAEEISTFGNKEVQLSAINYDLIVGGLDTLELKKLFREALEDSKLGLDVEEIMRSIRNGEVQFEKLNPVKAFVIAKRIQFLDIEKKWTQNVLD